MTGTFIFVCDRGFVIVGKAKIHDRMPLFWHLEKSSTIRTWGTKNGLSELQNGPTDSTVLDDVCERSLPFRSVLDIIHLTEKGLKEWTKRLS